MQSQIFDQIADDLATKGFGVYDHLFSPELISSLADESNVLAQESAFKAAGIGRKQDFIHQEAVRSDSIHWLTGKHNAGAAFLAEMECLRLAMNQRLFLGLFDYEAHYARYSIGAFYKKHLDAFRTQGRAGVNRKLSTVLYLNTSWQSAWGGELIIYPSQASELNDHAELLQRVVPMAGRLVIFLSEEFPHEVLPATHERKSIAGWFRVNEGVA